MKEWRSCQFCGRETQNRHGCKECTDTSHHEPVDREDDDGDYTADDARYEIVSGDVRKALKEEIE